jgi:hypothetical protein
MRQRHSELKLFRLLGCLRFPDEGVIFGSLSSQDRGEKEVCDCDDDKIGEIESKLSLGVCAECQDCFSTTVANEVRALGHWTQKIEHCT